MHDLLLNKRGISAPSNHPLRLVVEKQKARLAAEFTRARLKRGFATLEQFRADIEEQSLWDQVDFQPNEDEKVRDQGRIRTKWPHPRWARVNTLKTTLGDQLKTTFSDCTAVESLEEILSSRSVTKSPKILHIDRHIPNLLALPPGTDLSKTKAYSEGLIILQDKASCFPAHLLNLAAGEHCLDACAAPGNKTTQLSAILQEKNLSSSLINPEIHASERDPQRASLLETMVRKAGAPGSLHIHNQDFLQFNLSRSPWNHVNAILLDPSCSGSGIVGRDEIPSVTLPRAQAQIPFQARNKKKRKWSQTQSSTATTVVDTIEEKETNDNEQESSLQERLKALVGFQLRLLIHAFRFPKARKITYSTCSIYAEENENVVIQALLQSRNDRLGWRILPRNEQVEGLKAWHIRGDARACQALLSEASLDADEVAEACIRCEKDTIEGTQGFFVAAFVRDLLPSEMCEVEGDDVWEGFDDS